MSTEKNKACQKKDRKELKTETKGDSHKPFIFFSGLMLRRSPAVAHKERKTTINRNLLTEKEQVKESELGYLGEDAAAL